MNNSISFDPFSDRLARDIRNGLSTAFARAAGGSDTPSFEHPSATWLQADLPGPFAVYVEDRMQRYGRVLDRIQSVHENDPCRQALLAWNEQLYFEVHEILESIWHPAKGDFRKALQGLILASGVGEHLQYGHTKAADRLAIKADGLIRQNRSQLAFIKNLDELLAWLQAPGAKAPTLQTAKGWETY